MDLKTTILNNPEQSPNDNKNVGNFSPTSYDKGARYLYLRFLVVVIESLQGEAATCLHPQANQLFICILRIG